MVNAIAMEIAGRKEYLTEEITTVYFGGGTPSLLSEEQLNSLLTTIYDSFEVSDSAEITLEANPEDLSIDFARSIRDLGINRLSIGIQTFHNQKLEWMNRIHSSKESFNAVENARKAGFDNISLDLIYAIPDHHRSEWISDLEAVVSLKPQHISLYGLTIEDKTVFGKWERSNKLIQVPEDEAAEQYLLAISFLKDHDFIQYEVSNFGKAGFHSKHNNAYWSGVPYLGVGPGAHSYDGKFERRFNVSNNSKYLKAITRGEEYWGQEVLTPHQRINERILTKLRTKDGVDLSELETAVGFDLIALHRSFIKEMMDLDMIEISNHHLSLKPKGFLVADEIALRLFIPEN